MSQQSRETDRNEVRLEGWKEIGAYLSRTERTAKRWEKEEGLPVHRQEHKLRPSVYAYTSELNVWRARRRPGIGTPTRDTSRWWWRPVPALVSTSALAVVLLFAGGRPNIGLLHPAAAAADGGIVTRQVWPEAMDGIWAAPSPDGRFLSFLDWETGNLSLRDLEADSERLLTSGASTKDSWQQAYGSRWSPDGEQIAYSWWSKPDYQIRVVSLSSPEPRVVYGDDNVTWIELYDWSADGKWLLASVSRRAEPDRLTIISPMDGKSRVLCQIETGCNATFSSDGRHLVYDYQPSLSPDRDIRMVPLDGGTPRTLVDHPADDALVGWVPGSDWVLFTSDRTGSRGLWAVRTGGGAEEGPLLLKPDLGRVHPLGFADDGTLFYSDIKVARDVYELRVNPKTGEVTTPPEKMIRRYEGYNMGPRYSPDGKLLAYLSRRAGMLFPTNRANTLCVRSLDTGEERAYYGEFRKFGVRYVMGVRWLPDSSGITVAGVGLRRALYTVDLQSHSATEIAKWPAGSGPADHHWSPDGKRLYYSDRDKDEGVARILWLEPGTGRKHELLRLPRFDTLSLSLSPDGRWLAFTNIEKEDKALRIVSTDGGEPREIYRFPSKRHTVSHSWSADGEYLIFACKVAWPGSSLCRVPAEGGEVEELQREIRGLGGITTHPDGRRIAFVSATNYDTSTDIWAMQNYLPPNGFGN